ncbi:MAG: GNAT family N-acetyltransferase [Saprospiraceae bacterium]
MIIYENPEKDLKIEVVNQINKEIQDLLWATKWGTNGPIYQKVKNSDKDNNIHKPHFIVLKKSNKLIGMCTVSQRLMWFGEEEIMSCYLQHFSVKKEFQGKKYSQLLIDTAKKYFERIIDVPFIGYAYIEGSNIRSQKAAKFIGYDPVRNFKTIFFSRLFPKKHPNVRRYQSSEKVTILNKLKSFYKNYGFVHFTNTFHHDNYFVMERNGEIVAGVQAFPVEWKILEMPGLVGKIIMNIVPNIPIISRLFQPQKHQFLVFDSLFCQKGQEHDLIKLLESTLAELNHYSGLLWFDTRDNLFINLEAINQWGILDKVEGKLPVTTIAKIHNLPNQKIEEFKQMPMYIAGFDSI